MDDELIERDAERATLDEALGAAIGGAGRLLVIEAAPGLGKTRLLRALQEQASTTPRGLEGPRVRAGVQVRVRRRAPAARRRRPQRAPTPPSRAPRGSPSRSSPRCAPRPRTSCRSCTGSRGSSPGSPPSVRSCWSSMTRSGRMSRRGASSPSWPSGSTASRSCWRWRRARSTTIPRCRSSRPIPRRACSHRPRSPPRARGRSSARANIDPAFAGACHASTGGNPFYLGELARELPAPNVTALGPRTIAAAVKRRLDPEALKLARAVAVLGDGADPATAKALADIEDSDTAARALAAAGVLEQGLTFAHPIVRSAVYADIPREERANAHSQRRRAARAHGEPGTPRRAPARSDARERPAHRRHAARRGPPGAGARRREQRRRVPRPRAAGAAARGPARRAAHRAGRGRIPRGHRHGHRPPRAGDRARDGRADPHPRRDRARARAQVPGRVRARGADPAQAPSADGPLGEELEIERLGLAYLSVAARAATTLPRDRPERRPPRPGSKRSPSPRSRSTPARAATTPPMSPSSPRRAVAGDLLPPDPLGGGYGLT